MKRVVLSFTKLEENELLVLGEMKVRVDKILYKSQASEPENVNIFQL